MEREPLATMLQPVALRSLPRRDRRCIWMHKFFLDCINPSPQPRQFVCLEHGFGFECRRCVPPAVTVQSLLAQRIEVREQLVIVALRDRIIFVIVTLGTSEG